MKSTQSEPPKAGEAARMIAEIEAVQAGLRLAALALNTARISAEKSAKGWAHAAVLLAEADESISQAMKEVSRAL